jgi:hypothetical protein
MLAGSLCQLGRASTGASREAAAVFVNHPVGPRQDYRATTLRPHLAEEGEQLHPMHGPRRALGPMGQVDGSTHAPGVGEEDLRSGVGLEPLARAEDGEEGRPHGVVADQDVEGPVVFEALPTGPKRPSTGQEAGPSWRMPALPSA